MKRLILAGCISVAGLWLLTSAVRAQPAVYFSSQGSGSPGWAGPWYAYGTNTVRPYDSPTYGVSVGGLALAGTGFTAELWAAPEGATEAQLQPLRQTTFRTGTLAGTFSTGTSTPVPFAQAGQRIAYQVRVWDNRYGTVNSWAAVQASSDHLVYGYVCGKSAMYVSPQLIAPGSGATTLEFREGYNLSFDLHNFRLPLIATSTDGTTKYLTRQVGGGEDVTLSVESPNPGISPITDVQWSFGGTNLPGETNLTLRLPQIDSTREGSYTAVIKATVGPRVATLTNSTLVQIIRIRLVEPRLHPQRGFSARIEGVTNRIVQIDFCSDLRSWTPWITQYVGRVDYPCYCQNYFSNAFPLPANARFYRARVVP